MDKNSFVTEADAALGTQFLESGFVVRDVEDISSFEKLQNKVVQAANSYLCAPAPGSSASFLNMIHEQVTPSTINDLRLHILATLSQDDTVRALYYSLAKDCLAALVGNELAMQIRINLSVQLPGDSSSLLPVHADTWSGDSPFEVVVWVPLVDCFDTKSMYLLPPAKLELVDEFFKEKSKLESSEDLFREIEREVVWINAKEGQFVLFNQSLPHGNRVNQEVETRWSMNCRFKSVFSPYQDKKLGEFFEPITLRPASRVGIYYRFPGEVG